MSATYLDRILAAHRKAAKGDKRSLDDLAAACEGLPPTRGLRDALAGVARAGDVAVVAEVKRRSPSRGDLAADLDPAAVARAYAEGGAAAVSVLTDREFFGGSPEDLAAARAAVDLPVLRKDFTVGEADVYDTRLMGADAVLLIVAALDDEELGRLHSLAISVGLDVLVEVHDEDEADRAVEVGARLIGVNQRDLVTFEVDTARALRVAGRLPEGVVRVAESGITDAAEAARLAAAGYHAVLVGESLVTSSSPAEAVSALRHSRHRKP